MLLFSRLYIHVQVVGTRYNVDIDPRFQTHEVKDTKAKLLYETGLTGNELKYENHYGITIPTDNASPMHLSLKGGLQCF